MYIEPTLKHTVSFEARNSAKVVTNTSISTRLEYSNAL